MKGIWIRVRSGRKEVWIDFKDEGKKRHRRKIGLDSPETRRLAKEVLLDRQYEVQEYRHFPQRRAEKAALCVTFREAADLYWTRVGRKRDKNWRYRWNELVDRFGPLPLVDVNALAIQDWYDSKVEETSVGTANTTLTLLSAIFNKATHWDMFKLANPVKKVEKESEPQPRTRFLSRDEMVIFFAKCDRRLLPLVFFSLLTGLRKREALWFGWEGVASDLSGITVHRSKSGTHPYIPVAGKLRQLLISLGPRREGRLFDLCEMTFRRLFEKARKEAMACGVAHFTWHDLRRTFGSHFTMSTKDRPSLRKLLGQRTNYMVDRYSYLDDDHLRGQMEKFDAAMPELSPTLLGLVPDEDCHHPRHQVIAGQDGESRKLYNLEPLSGS